jgi:hypothetical protein
MKFRVMSAGVEELLTPEEVCRRLKASAPPEAQNEPVVAVLDPDLMSIMFVVNKQPLETGIEEFEPEPENYQHGPLPEFCAITWRDSLLGDDFSGWFSEGYRAYWHEEPGGLSG